MPVFRARFTGRFISHKAGPVNSQNRAITGDVESARFTQKIAKFSPQALQPWAHWLALKGQHTKNALMRAAQWLPPNEPLQRLDTKCELRLASERFAALPLIADVPDSPAGDTPGHR